MMGWDMEEITFSIKPSFRESLGGFKKAARLPGRGNEQRMK
jgi:hypothetical protein